MRQEPVGRVSYRPADNPRRGLVEMTGRLVRVEPLALACGPAGVKRRRGCHGSGIGVHRRSAGGRRGLITNITFAGHHATETVGVRALAAHLSQRFNVPLGFLNHPTGM